MTVASLSVMPLRITHVPVEILAALNQAAALHAALTRSLVLACAVVMGRIAAPMATNAT